MKIHVNSQNLDLIPFICEAFSETPETYWQIERMYKRNLKKYKEAVKNKSMMKNAIITGGNIQKEEYGKKAFALLLHLDEENIREDILKIINENWQLAYLFVANKETIDLGLFADLVRNKYEKTITIRSMNTHLIIAIALSNLLSKPIEETDFAKDYFDLLLNREKYYDRSINARKEHFIERIEKNSKQEIRKQRMIMDTKCSGIREMSLVEEIPRTKIMAKSLNLLFQSEGLDMSALLNGVKLSEKDIESVFAGCLNARIEPDPQIREYMYAFCIKSLLSLFKDTKKYYFENEKDIVYTEEKLLSEINIIQHNLAKEELKTRSMAREIEELKREINTLKNDLEISDDLVREFWLKEYEKIEEKKQAAR